MTFAGQGGLINGAQRQIANGNAECAYGRSRPVCRRGHSRIRVILRHSNKRYSCITTCRQGGPSLRTCKLRSGVSFAPKFLLLLPLFKRGS